ncbi:MAG: GAF domain-containing sensor histidine kinase [Actinobacteria bacterium]|nr:MAG: GAF domain-containing sensor histidine kinase [Actinomycetota bacterium]
MAETLDSRALGAVSDVVVTIAAEHRFEPVLEQLADAARQLAGARYAAIGVPDGEGGFSHFITSGMTQKQYDAIGELPRQHGLLGAMLETAESHRFPNIQKHPRFEGWPDEHPNMRSFLGVPIASQGDVIGAFYLTDKKGPRGAVFSDADLELIETLSAHAAVAIDNARLYERSRELTVVEERNRSAMAEMRSLIFELRPGDVVADGLAVTLQKHIDVLRRVYGTEIELKLDGAPQRSPDAAVQREIFRIAQEAIANALKHSGAEHVRVYLEERRNHLRVTIHDDGCGFDAEGPQARRRLGLISMRERAEEIGGAMEVRSEPRVGTTVTMEIDLGSQA